jgi:hypothetical protein
MENENLKPASGTTPLGATGAAGVSGGEVNAVKRGRGRPPGSVKLAPLGAGKPAPGKVPGQPAGNIPVPLWTGENSRPFAELVFMVPTIATGWDGWELNDKEARMIAEPLAQVLNIFVPVGSQYAAVAALASTVFVVGGMKYKNFREYAEVKAKEAASAEKK